MMDCLNLKLNDIFPSWKTSGIISAITAISGYTPPWSTAIDATTLNIQYHGNRSGNKHISPLVESLVDYTTDPPSILTADVTILATVIKSMYSTNWTKLWATLSFDYKPLENAYTTETTERTITDTGTVTDSGDIVHGETVATTSTVTASQDSSTYGFNSATAVPTDEQGGTNTGNGSETHSGTDSTGNTRTNNLSHGETETYNRSGSIGVITPQVMIKQERETWMWQAFDSIFSDIDKVLTIPVY